MIQRKYKADDIQQMISILENDLKTTTYKNVEFSRTKMQDLLIGNMFNDEVFCEVIEEDGEIIGGMFANVASPFFTHERFAYDHFLYVKEGKRNIRMATGLVAAYVKWAKTQKVRRISLSNSMGKNVETFARLAKMLGFEQTGTIHVMEI
jgi:L-amino acid N-acyltransferase YncA